MRRFAASLNATSRALDLPQPEKAQVLVELAADMEDYYQYCLDQGMSPERAREEAEERLQPSSAALAELRAVHTHGLSAWLRGPRGANEFVLAMVALGGVLMLSPLPLQPLRLIAAAGVFSWPAIGVALLATGMAVWHLGRAAVGRSPDVRVLRRCADWLVRATTALGVCAIALHLAAVGPMLAIAIGAATPGVLERGVALAALLSVTFGALALSVACTFAIGRQARIYELAMVEELLVAPDPENAFLATRAISKEETCLDS